MNEKDTAAMIVEEIEWAIASFAIDGELLKWMNKVRDMAKTLSTSLGDIHAGGKSRARDACDTNTKGRGR